MPASDSRAFPHSPNPYRARVTFFSFPVSWALLEAYPERESPDRSELEAALRNRPLELIPLDETLHEDSSDHWEMVIPKMARPAYRAQRTEATDRLAAESSSPLVRKSED